MNGYMPSRPLFALLALVAAFCSILPAHAQREPLTDEELATVESRWPEAQRTITGIRYIIHEAGHGDPARDGDVLQVTYKGMLLDGKVFNECLTKDAPFKFRLGRGQVIDGWDQVFKLFCEGSKATVIIPYELAYGTLGQPPMVPRQSTLVFEVEVLSIERGSTPPPAATPEPKKKKRFWF